MLKDERVPIKTTQILVIRNYKLRVLPSSTLVYLHVVVPLQNGREDLGYTEPGHGEEAQFMAEFMNITDDDGSNDYYGAKMGPMKWKETSAAWVICCILCLLNLSGLINGFGYGRPLHLGLTKLSVALLP